MNIWPAIHPFLMKGQRQTGGRREQAGQVHDRWMRARGVQPTRGECAEGNVLVDAFCRPSRVALRPLPSQPRLQSIHKREREREREFVCAGRHARTHTCGDWQLFRIAGWLVGWFVSRLWPDPYHSPSRPPARPPASFACLSDLFLHLSYPQSLSPWLCSAHTQTTLGMFFLWWLAG